MEFETILDVSVPPTQVWGLLTDFAGYPDWHPFVRIEGETATGAMIRYTLRRTEKARGRAVDAMILRYEPDRELIITFGVKPFVTIEETYRIETEEGRSRVSHGFTCRGILPRIAGRARLEKRLMPLLALPLKRLEQRLNPARVAPRKAAPVSRRKGFRQPKKRR